MNELIEILQNKQLVWQGAAKQTSSQYQSTGYSTLDEQLNGGFPQSGVIEVLSDIAIGELRLLMPSVTKDNNRLLVFIAPPGIVNAHMLAGFGIDLKSVIVVYPKDQKNALWSAELCLKSGACHSVLMWANDRLEIHQIKRLQLASEKGDSRQFLIRARRYEDLSLPVDVSLSLTAETTGLKAKINKRKRGWPSDVFNINMQSAWPKLTRQIRPDNVILFPERKVG